MVDHQVVLTDIAQNIWHDEYTLTEQSGLQLEGSADWSLSKRTLKGGLSAGVDVIDVNNGALEISILPTRGMGLWRGRFRGIDIGWHSPVTWPVHPKLVNLTERNGLGWLTGFNELLCRCGLASNGPPGTDTVLDNNGNEIETQLTLHGRIANTPAHYVAAQVSKDGMGSLSVVGEVDETMMFGPCLRLQSTLTTDAGSNEFSIVDSVLNLADQPAELQLLYHTNIGSPFLESGSQLSIPFHELAPRDLHAAQDIDQSLKYGPPTRGYREQVYFMRLAADSNGQSLMLLRNANGKLGISLSFDVSQLPCFSLWKNTQAERDGYVLGLEPGTGFPNLKTYERLRGRVVNLEPGETYQSRLSIAIHDTPEQVTEVQQAIAAIQEQQPPTIHRQPNADFSPAD